MDIRATLRARLDAAVGGEQVLTDPADIAPYLTDWRGRYHGRALAVVRPGSTEQVAAVVRACADLGVPDRAAGRQHRPVRRRDAGRRAATRSSSRSRG